MTRTTIIGEHRGNHRLWLEGRWLHDAGFKRGDHYSTTSTPDAVILTLDPTAARKVSGKVKNGHPVSVIDINSSIIVRFTGKAFVVVEGPTITITKEGTHAL